MQTVKNATYSRHLQVNIVYKVMQGILFCSKAVVFYPLWTISNLMPLDWTTRLKPRWLRLMLSLNCSLNSGLLLFFTVPVLSLWGSSYTYTHTNEFIKTHLNRQRVAHLQSPSGKDSYRAGKRKLKFYTSIQIISRDTCRDSRYVWLHVALTDYSLVISKMKLTSVPDGAGRLMPRMMYSIRSVGDRVWWILWSKISRDDHSVPASWVTEQTVSLTGS